MASAAEMERGAVHARLSRRGQSGFTLIEAIVSLALVTTVILALAAGMLTSARSSNAAKANQIVDGALSAYAESFKGEYPAVAGCPLPTDFEALAPEPAWFTAPDTDVVDYEVTKTQGWDESASTWLDCPAGPASGVTRLTVQVTADTPAGEETATGQVVVRSEP